MALLPGRRHWFNEGHVGKRICLPEMHNEHDWLENTAGHITDAPLPELGNILGRRFAKKKLYKEIPPPLILCNRGFILINLGKISNSPYSVRKRIYTNKTEKRSKLKRGFQADWLVKHSPGSERKAECLENASTSERVACPCVMRNRTDTVKRDRYCLTDRTGTVDETGTVQQPKQILHGTGAGTDVLCLDGYGLRNFLYNWKCY